MISLRIDSKGLFRVRWPQKSADILQLGQSYIQHENSLPVGSQVSMPALVLVQAAYEAAQAAQLAATNGENTRAVAAETYRQTVIIARAHLEIAIWRLKSKYLGNLAQLEQWGLHTVANNRGVSVRKPKNEKDWVAFLQAYVAKEMSLPAEEQISDPPLAEMAGLNETVQGALAARTAGRNQRETHVQARGAEMQRLLDLLQLAALALVIVNDNGVVTNGLQMWGYEVTAVNTSSD